MKRIYWVILSLMILSTACAQAVDVQSVVSTEPYGFWSGCWHGIIAPISFFISLFDQDVAIYAVNNNGGWYDFGFVLGAGILFGGGGKGSSRKKG
jgi:hypothetical protein